jgi:hypothetical protein
MSDMFEYLEAQAISENLPFKNSAVVAIDRSERRFGAFVSSAKGNKEFQSRLALIVGDIEKIAADACEEYGYDDPKHIAKLVIGQIQLLAETQKLKSQDPEGYYTEPSPKLNPGSAGDNMKNTNPAIPELKPNDKQHPSDKEWPWDSALPEANLVDADKPMQPEFNVGDHTDTWTKPENKAVTTKTADRNWNNSEFDEEEAIEDEEAFPDESSSLDKYFDTDESGDIDLDFEEDDIDPDLEEDDLDEEYDETLPDVGMGGHQRSKNPDDIKNWKNYRNEQYKPTMAKAAAERMDFNSLSEMMTPSDAVGHLVEAGMPSHEAQDRIDFYVNHVNPGWAAKNWTSADESRHLYDRSMHEDKQKEEYFDPFTVDDLADEADEERTHWHDDDEQKSIGELYDPEEGDEFLDPTIASIKNPIMQSITSSMYNSFLKKQNKK